MKTELNSDKLIPFLSEKFKTDLKFNPNSVIERKEVFINKVQSVNDEEGSCECIISTEEPDRVGDVVVSTGIDTSEFKKIPSVYVNHNYAALPVAVCESLVHKGKEIIAKIKFVTAVPAIKNIFELVKAGALRGVSIGFEPQEMLQKGTREFDTYVKDAMMDSAILSKIRRIFKTWKLYEFSVCSVPANSSCYIKSLIDAKQEVSPDLAKIMGYEEPKTETIVTKEVKTETVVGDVKEIKIETEEKKDVETVIEEILKTEEVEVGIVEEFKDADDFDIVLKPFPGFHASRQRDPSEFQEGSFRYLKDRGGRGIDFIVGRLKGSTSLTLQSIRFDKDVFTTEEARKWCKDHGYKDNVEPATSKTIEPEVVITKEPLKYFNIIRTHADVEEYIKKAVEAKLSGKLNIDW